MNTSTFSHSMTAVISFLLCFLLFTFTTDNGILKASMPSASSKGISMEVFILENDSTVHFWQELTGGLITGSGKLFKHSHPDSLHFLEFNIHTCEKGGSSIIVPANKHEIKFISDLLRNIENPGIVKIVY